MVNWSDPKEIALDNDVFDKLIFTFFGLNLWEIFVTCDFEWSLITRRRKFRWPLVLFFFLSRYCIILSFIGLIVSMSVRTEVNCRALYTFNSWAGNMTLLSSSTSLMLRTIALWERKLLVVVLLGILCVAHWAVLWRGMFIVESTWNPEISACYVTQTNPGLLNVTFFYTIAFDFTVLIFTTVALTYKHSARTDLWKLLFQDGLVYFLLTFSSNCIPAVLNVLNLNGEHPPRVWYSQFNPIRSAMMNVIATVSIQSSPSPSLRLPILSFANTPHRSLPRLSPPSSPAAASCACLNSTRRTSTCTPSPASTAYRAGARASRRTHILRTWVHTLRVKGTQLRGPRRW
ncbi:uncharacterized protein SCHCODRAFT_01080613 [Schizophyllum commune H4-8]|uniref:G-protein coupled receptors family 1 profile domain-containing protein n=1 Tax=Schizophyllum commune (strain H4-8 / FGSC 9210) TaxID=578458 RepID=D8PKH6_SCHCM|nr:uncharacterized protein SCHCODRAFT_01080613 [Schizophyllum commune H4-8]KAI5894160.1 hypothetical protein SCHCODRAFT_01080613 [Schizophyllum commune H4-8]